MQLLRLLQHLLAFPYALSHRLTAVFLGWTLFAPILLPVVWCGNGCPPYDNRACLHALLYVLRTGIGVSALFLQEHTLRGNVPIQLMTPV